MIELTADQLHALEQPDAIPPRLVNPLTNETFILLRVEEYERLKQTAYDDSSWTRDELESLAWEATEHEDWDEFNDRPAE